jgi:LmbE family N-acetylglucosaminyl deacetylase
MNLAQVAMFLLLPLALGLVSAQVWALLANRRFRRRRRAVPPPARLLVVVAHPDDETIVAGGAMIQAMKAGGIAHLIYTMDGVTRAPSASQAACSGRITQREQEALAALRQIGISSDSVTFLRLRNQVGLRALAPAREAAETIALAIRTFRPDRILIPAFEGGHIDHDLTHCVAMAAAKWTGFPPDRLFEAPEYNDYCLREAVKRRLNKLLPLRFVCAPRSLPIGTIPTVLQMSPDELDRKRQMLSAFQTCDPTLLVKQFGFPDQFRPVPAYDYSRAPFHPSTTWLSRLNPLLRLRPADRVGFFPTHLTARDYADALAALQPLLVDNWAK